VDSYVSRREQWIPRPIDEVFAFFADAENLEAITRKWLGFQIVSPKPTVMQREARIHYRIRWHELTLHWLSEIQSWMPPTESVDVQVRGPYRLWHHTHGFEPVDGGTRIRDVVRYALPLGPLGCLAYTWRVKSNLESIFDHRACRASELLESRRSHE
jgi:ligand-binding SRPBCC domain-containing protein